MSIYVPAFHPGEILAELYLEPLNMSAGQLAKVLGLDRQRIERLVKGECAISTDTAERLAKAFSTTTVYWMNLQNAWEIQEYLKDPEKQRELDKIEPIVVSEEPMFAVG